MGKNPPKLTELSGMDFICRPPLGLLKLVQQRENYPSIGGWNGGPFNPLDG